MSSVGFPINVTSYATSVQTVFQELNKTDESGILLNQNLTGINTIEPNPANMTIENKTRQSFITSAIDGNGNQLTNNGTTNSRSVTFNFEKPHIGSYFACAIDNQSITTCTSPIRLINLTLGDHLFEIQPFQPDISILPNGTQIVSAIPFPASEVFHWRILPVENYNRP